MVFITFSSFADVHTRIVHVYEDDLVEAYEEVDERHDTWSLLCSNKVFSLLGHGLVVHHF